MEEEEEITVHNPPIRMPPEVRDGIELIKRIINLLEQSKDSGDSLDKNLSITDLIEDFTNIRDTIGSSDFRLTALSAYTNFNKQLRTTNESLRMLVNSSGENSLAEFYQSYNVVLEHLPQIKNRRTRNFTIEEADSLLNQTKRFATEINGIKLAAQKELLDLGNLRIKGEELIQLLAGRALKDSYQIRADDEKKSAKDWTYLTMGFAGAAIASLIGTFIWQIYNLNENVINYQFLSTKVLFTITLGLAAKWTSKRANRHLMEESKYHRLAVNMATINAFIAPLEKEEQSVVISSIALKIFTDGSGNDAPTDYETANAIELVKGLFSKLDK